MLCEICGKNYAEKKLNKSINGTIRTLAVCKDCFNRGGENAPRKERKCNFCGRTLTQINETLIVGCPKCYEVFREELSEIIRQVQQL